MQKSNFLELVAKERTRQIFDKGYTSEHDDEHTNGEIANAAACYAATVPIFKVMVNTDIFPMKAVYPWQRTFFSKEDHSRKQQLIIAAAFINAEYDRIVRLEEKGETING